jgi:alanine racemase
MFQSSANIHLSILAQNIETVRTHLPDGVYILFAVKSNAYGHGIEAVSRVAAEVGLDALGVNTIEEGKRIRDADISLPILLLSPVAFSEIHAALELDLTLSLSDLRFARHLSHEAMKMHKRAHVHVHIDTGMRRFGIRPEHAMDLFEQLQTLSSVEVEGVFSHLCAAQSPEKEDHIYTLAQIEQFEAFLTELNAVNLLPPLRHISNSAGVIKYEDRVISQRLNMIRIGTLFYGYAEVARPWAQRVKPVATLVTPIVAITDLEPGDYVGYGRGYQASTPQRIAIIPVGYSTGIHPQFANRGTVWVNGHSAPLVGHICLNHTFVDVTRIGDVSVGDTVEVLGPHSPADLLAKKANLTVCQLLVPALQSAEERTYV